MRWSVTFEDVITLMPLAWNPDVFSAKLAEQGISVSLPLVEPNQTTEFGSSAVRLVVEVHVEYDPTIQMITGETVEFIDGEVKATPIIGDIPVEALRTSRITQAEDKTKLIFSDGVPARVNDVWYRFDTRTGVRAAANWAILGNVINLVANGAVPGSAVFPKNISTIGDSTILVLNTVAEAIAFWTELMTMDANIATEGAVIRKQLVDATTVEEINAIIDIRLVPYPIPGQ